jgi:hypothetical protein
MNIKFSGVSVSNEKIQFIIHIYKSITTHLELPETIYVTLTDLGSSSYGETILSPTKKNSIILNSQLTTKELFYPTIHELVHVSQIHTGRLAISRTGVYVWENKTYPVDPNKMPYKEYQKLPWERDAHEQQIILGKKLLENQ